MTPRSARTCAQRPRSNPFRGIALRWSVSTGLGVVYRNGMQLRDFVGVAVTPGHRICGSDHRRLIGSEQRVHTGGRAMDYEDAATSRVIAPTAPAAPLGRMIEVLTSLDLT